MTLTAIDNQLLATIADLHGTPQGAFNIRKDGEKVDRRSSANIEIISKTDKPGIDIIVKPGTKNESVHIPVILTKTGLNDMVYNTFEIGEDSDVLVVAGCGIHNAGDQKAQHDGVHTFYVRKGAKMKYTEKHYGEGPGTGERVLNPKTYIVLEEGASAEVELVQIRGINHTERVTEAILHPRASLKIIERLLTHGDQKADSNILVSLTGEDSNVQVIARSVAQERSFQVFRATLKGQQRCRGHLECDSIIMDQAVISASPQLYAEHADAELTHEAAIGKIAGDQLLKLMSLGLTEKQAVDTILTGFLR
ncbi:MAG: SufD family Fe-S cluster assembly protein [Firmicutes bacterium]|nr:SufD family Fe-S cluster assembly protein [Bacillota bacterium]